VDHSSHLVLGVDLYTILSSLSLENVFGDASVGGTQCWSGAGKSFAAGAISLWRGTGAVTLKSVGLYLFMTHTVSLSAADPWLKLCEY